MNPGCLAHHQISLASTPCNRHPLPPLPVKILELEGAECSNLIYYVHSEVDKKCFRTLLCHLITDDHSFLSLLQITQMCFLPGITFHLRGMLQLLNIPQTILVSILYPKYLPT